MKYDSVLDQQSISGKIVSLILCVWKPCYVKSGHIWLKIASRFKLVIAISQKFPEGTSPLAGKFYMCVLYTLHGECILALSSPSFIVTIWTL